MLIEQSSSYCLRLMVTARLKNRGPESLLKLLGQVVHCRISVAYGRGVLQQQLKFPLGV